MTHRRRAVLRVALLLLLAGWLLALPHLWHSWLASWRTAAAMQGESRWQ